MSYESVIIGKNPDLYVPFRSFFEGAPVGIIQFRPVNVVGESKRFRSNKFPRSSLQLSNSSIKLEDDAPFFIPPATYMLWFYKFQQSGPVFFIGDDQSGFGFSVDENFNLVVFFDGTESATLPFGPDDSFHMLSVVIDYDVFSGEELSYRAMFYFDGDLVFEQEIDDIPGIENIYINSFYSEQASSGVFAHLAAFGRAMSEFEIGTIYQIATTGRQRLVISEETDIPFSDTEQNIVKTSWQAYGIVTGKI